MAEITAEQLEVMYPNMRAYIRAARKRGYTPADIDEALTSGITERRKAGKSLADINAEYGIDTPEPKGYLESALGGFTGAPDLQEGTPLAPVDQSANREVVKNVGLAARGTAYTAAGGDYMRDSLRGGAQVYQAGAQKIGVDAPRALAAKTDNDTLGALAEALMRGVIPGLQGGGFPGTQAADDLYTEQYPNMDPLLRNIGPSRFEMGLPIPSSAVPAAESMAAHGLPMLGRFARPAAVGLELGTIGDANFMDQVPAMAKAVQAPPPRFTDQMPQLPALHHPQMRQMETPRPAPIGAPMDAEMPTVAKPITPDVQTREQGLARLQNVDSLPEGPESGFMLFHPKDRHQTGGPLFSPVRMEAVRREMERQRIGALTEAKLGRDVGGVPKGQELGQFDAGKAAHFANAKKAGRMADLTPEQQGVAFSMQRGKKAKGKKRSVGAGGPDDMGTPDIYGPMEDTQWKTYEESAGGNPDIRVPTGPRSNPELDATFGFKNEGIPYHTARPTDIPRSQSLAVKSQDGNTEAERRVLSQYLNEPNVRNEVVDSTRYIEENISHFPTLPENIQTPGGGAAYARAMQIAQNTPAVVRRPMDANGNAMGTLNLNAFPGRLPMGDRQPGASGKVTVEGPGRSKVAPGTKISIPEGKGVYQVEPGTEAARHQAPGVYPGSTAAQGPVRMEGGETSIPERPRNRAGQELDTGKMAVRQEAALQNPMVLRREIEYRQSVGAMDAAGRKSAEYTQSVSGPQKGPYADPNRQRKDIPGVDELTKRERDLDSLFDKKFTSEFSAGPGGQFMRDMDNIADRAMQAIKKATARDAREPRLGEAIRLFQKGKRSAIQQADDLARGIRDELVRMKKAGANPEEVKEFQTFQYEYLKRQLGVQTSAFRSAYLGVAKKMFPEASAIDLLAEAGEVAALQNGLALSPWTRAAKAAGVGVAKGVGIVKTIKVLGSSTAYANNIGSNLISTFLGGGSVTDVKAFAESIAEFRAGSELYNEALQEGLFGTEFFSKQLDDVFRELELAAKDGKSVADIIEATWRTSTGSAARLYDGIDKVFKFHMYKEARTSGVKLGTRSKKFGKKYGDLVKLSEHDAVEHVNRYFPNYERLSPMMQRARKNPVTALAANPFLAFPVEFARIYKNAAVDHPLRFFGAAAAMTAAVAATAQATGDKPDYHKFPNKVGLAIPFTDDGTGKPRVIDLTYMIPLADTFSGEAWRKDKSTIDNVQQMLKNGARNTLGRGFLSPQDEKFQQPGAPDFGDSIYRLATERSGASAREFVQQGIPNLLVPPALMKASQLGQKRAYGEDPGALREAGEFVGIRLQPDSKIEAQRDKSEFRGRLGDLEDQLRRVQNQKQLDPATRNDRERRIREQIKALKLEK